MIVHSQENKTAQGNQDDNDVGDFYYEPHLLDYLALCTDNLSAPEIALPGENFNTIIYTGDGDYIKPVLLVLDFSARLELDKDQK